MSCFSRWRVYCLYYGFFQLGSSGQFVSLLVARGCVNYFEDLVDILERCGFHVPTGIARICVGLVLHVRGFVMFRFGCYAHYASCACNSSPCSYFGQDFSAHQFVLGHDCHGFIFGEGKFETPLVCFLSRSVRSGRLCTCLNWVSYRGSVELHFCCFRGSCVFIWIAIASYDFFLFAFSVCFPPYDILSISAGCFEHFFGTRVGR